MLEARICSHDEITRKIVDMHEHKPKHGGNRHEGIVRLMCSRFTPEK